MGNEDVVLTVWLYLEAKKEFLAERKSQISALI